jgi:transcriptional regulator with XRE-family HTH domain
MPERSRDYYDQFRDRLKAIRAELGYSQEQMATALGISLAVYQKYEIRSKFPPHLLEPLALIARRDIAYVVTGRSPALRIIRTHNVG